VWPTNWPPLLIGNSVNDQRLLRVVVGNVGDLAADVAMITPRAGLRLRAVATTRFRRTGRRDLGLLPEGQRRAALCTAVIARAFTLVVFPRECGVDAGLIAPGCLKLDGFLALQGKLGELVSWTVV
jgi:hypothetical protein